MQVVLSKLYSKTEAAIKLFMISYQVKKLSHSEIEGAALSGVRTDRQNAPPPPLEAPEGDPPESAVCV